MFRNRRGLEVVRTAQEQQDHLTALTAYEQRQQVGAGIADADQAFRAARKRGDAEAAIAAALAGEALRADMGLVDIAETRYLTAND